MSNPPRQERWTSSWHWHILTEIPLCAKQGKENITSTMWEFKYLFLLYLFVCQRVKLRDRRLGAGPPLRSPSCLNTSQQNFQEPPPVLLLLWSFNPDQSFHDWCHNTSSWASVKAQSRLWLFTRWIWIMVMIWMWSESRAALMGTRCRQGHCLQSAVIVFTVAPSCSCWGESIAARPEERTRIDITAKLHTISWSVSR